MQQFLNRKRKCLLVLRMLGIQELFFVGQLESIPPKASYHFSFNHPLNWVHEYKSQGSLDIGIVLNSELQIPFYGLFPPAQEEKQVLGNSSHISYFTNRISDVPETAGLTAAAAEKVRSQVHWWMLFYATRPQGILSHVSTIQALA